MKGHEPVEGAAVIILFVRFSVKNSPELIRELHDLDRNGMLK